MNEKQRSLVFWSLLAAAPLAAFAADGLRFPSFDGGGVHLFRGSPHDFDPREAFDLLVGGAFVATAFYVRAGGKSGDRA